MSRKRKYPGGRQLVPGLAYMLNLLGKLAFAPSPLPVGRWGRKVRRRALRLAARAEKGLP